MPRVVHFEIHADDTARAVKFYTEVFGWEFKQWATEPAEYWLITTGTDGPGIDGGLLKRMGSNFGDAITAFTCTIDVPSVDDYMAKALENGGVLALPKMAIPGAGWVAYFMDTEKNVVGLHQSDPSAA